MGVECGVVCFCKFICKYFRFFDVYAFVLFLVLVFCRFDRQFTCYPVIPVSDPDFHDSIFYSCRKLRYSPCVESSIIWYFRLCLFLSFMKFCRQLSFIPAVFGMIMVLVAFLYEFCIQWCNFLIKSTSSPVSICALLQFFCRLPNLCSILWICFMFLLVII